MIRHYLAISLRNIRKYKAQSIISICAMAASMTLMAIITSFIMYYLIGNPIFDTPYTNRIEILHTAERGDAVSTEILELVLGHQFDCVEDIHYVEIDRYATNVTANPGESTEKAMLTSSATADPEFFAFAGVRSEATGDLAAKCRNDEVVISESLAKKLYGDTNPIGSRINLHIFSFDNSSTDRTYTVRDVLRRPPEANVFFSNYNDVYFYDQHKPATGMFKVYIRLREGYTAEDLAKELKALSDTQFSESVNAKMLEEQTTGRLNERCDMVIAFLFLLVCVSFASYLRQECQFFRLREREVAIRTCCGGKPRNLFALFFTEIATVLLLTLGATFLLDWLARTVINEQFTVFQDMTDWTIAGTMRTETITTMILIAISAVVVAITVRQIRRDQTGLALRMKPRPKHRLRNIGITLQMIISLLFISVTAGIMLSMDSITDADHLPKNLDDYRRPLILRMNGVAVAESEEAYDMIDRLPSVQRVYRFFYYMTSYVLDSEYQRSDMYTIYMQDGNDYVDFNNLVINEEPSYNPDRNIIINEKFKQFLITNDLWNGKTVDIHGKPYDIRGTFDAPLYDNGRRMEKAVIITDNEGNSDDGSKAQYDRIIVPKEGMEKQAREDIEDILRQVFPSRIDIGPRLFYDELFYMSQIINAMLTILLILTLVSIVTTVATIYASVSLDTRRRRKEMGLRKLNGATGKVIGRLFLRSYLLILAAAVTVSLPLFIIFATSPMLDINSIHTDMGHVLGAYAIGLGIAVLITGLTIFWKIRRIMHVDPVEYLKE